MFDDLDLRDADGWHVPKPELQELAGRILQLFSALRTRYAPPGKAFGSVGKKYAIHFYRAAQLCQELRMTAEAYVDIVLRHMSANGNFWPNAIADRTPFDDYKELEGDRNAQALRGYTAQMDLFQARERLYGARTTLADVNNRFSPLFRAVMAHKHGYRDIVDCHVATASLEYAATPVAAEVFDGELEFLHEWQRHFDV